jgi:hypothetical protein
MAFDTESLTRQSIEVIKEHNLYFIQDVVSYLPCSRQTFYAHGLDKVDTINELLEQNKIFTKVKLRKKWEDSDNATLQMGLMKLLCTEEERQRLAMEYKKEEHTGELTIIRKVING